MIALLRRLLPGSDTVAIRNLDGVLRPNSALDQAPTLAEIDQPDDLAALAGSLIVSSGSTLLEIKRAGDKPKLRRQFSNVVSTIASSGNGDLAVGLESKGIELVEGQFKGKSWGKLGGRALHCPTAMTIDGTRLIVCIGSADLLPSQWTRDLLTGGHSGSVWQLDMASGASECLADGLAWPSGVMVRRGSIYVSEAWRHRLLELVPDKQPRVVADQMPGYPGRLTATSGGGAWLSVFAPQNRLVELVMRQPEYCSRMIAELDPSHWIAPSLRAGKSLLEPMQGGAVRVHGTFKPWAPSFSSGLLVHLGDDFEPRSSYHSRTDGHRHGITASCEWDGQLIAASKGDGALCAIPLTGGSLAGGPLAAPGEQK